AFSLLAGSERVPGVRVRAAEGQPARHRRASTRTVAAGEQAAAVPLRYLSSDEQPHAEAGNHPSTCPTPERREQRREVLRRQADALVGHLDEHAILGPVDADLDGCGL